MPNETNINELLDLLSISGDTLRYNSEIEENITQNGGTILYSYNNIIVASEISDESYSDLMKNNNIDFLQDLPLKKYGNIDINLIGQFNGTLVVDDNISGSTSESPVGVSPTIINDFYTLSALTNEKFNYNILASGSLPITYEFIDPSNYLGDISLDDVNVINGVSSDVGIFGITFNAYNKFGVDTKKLILTIVEDVKIVNETYNVHNKLGTYFSYIIDTIGPAPKTYSVIPNLPSGVVLDGNVISGTFTTSGTYTMSIGASGMTSSDSKELIINVGVAPVITSDGEVVVEEYSLLEYGITSTLTSDVTYNVIGILPLGLSFDGNDTVSGVPLEKGSFDVTLKAYNYFGESLKKLTIVIYGIG